MALKDQPRMERREFKGNPLQTPDGLCTVCNEPFAPLDRGDYQPNWAHKGGRAHANCVQPGSYTGHFGNRTPGVK